jgi:hypothetical protein
MGRKTPTVRSWVLLLDLWFLQQILTSWKAERAFLGSGVDNLLAIGNFATEKAPRKISIDL